jgi:flagellar basal body-associated protein FliL
MSSNNTEEEAPTGAKSGTIVVAIVVPSVLIILLLGLIIMSVATLVGYRALSMSKLTMGTAAGAPFSDHVAAPNLVAKRSAGKRDKTS